MAWGMKFGQINNTPATSTTAASGASSGVTADGNAQLGTRKYGAQRMSFPQPEPQRQMFAVQTDPMSSAGFYQAPRRGATQMSATVPTSVYAPNSPTTVEPAPPEAPPIAQMPVVPTPVTPEVPVIDPYANPGAPAVVPTPVAPQRTLDGSGVPVGPDGKVAPMGAEEFTQLMQQRAAQGLPMNARHISLANQFARGDEALRSAILNYAIGRPWNYQPNPTGGAQRTSIPQPNGIYT